MRMLLILFLLFSKASADTSNFNKNIKPLLSKKCFSCHGRDKQKGKLRLDIREEAIQQKVIIPGEPEKSLLIKKLISKDLDEIMPPAEHGDPLSNAEIELLKAWIKEGAKYSSHWSFEKVAKPTIKNTKDDWSTNPIDTFVLSALKDKELPPSTEASKETILRRLSLTLTGLPPDNESAENFMSGKINYKQLCDKLLSSQAYGEKMAIFWLDGARYADTNGIEYDNSRPIWPYRDWVINAFNDNMPYDQFIVEQLAGDLLPDPSISQIVATGFNRCHMTTNEQGSLEEEFLVRYAKDRLNTTSTVFLGLTMACAECHDHKYDPISQKEYYQLLGYFNNIKEIAVGQPFNRGDAPLIPITTREQQKKLNSLNSSTINLEKKLSKIKLKADFDFLTWHYDQLINPPKTLFLIGQMDAYFPLDENEGSYTFNLVTEHMCNIKGTISRTKGFKNQALSFRGYTMVDCLNICNYDQNDSFSAGFWINMEERASGVPLAKFDSALKRGWKFYVNESELYFELLHNQNNGVKIKTDLNKSHFGNWIHVCATYNGSSKAEGSTIYINGTKVKTETVMDNLSGTIHTEGNLRIGAESFAGPLIASDMDEIFALKKILTPNEILAVSQFDANSRFALVKPTNLSKEAKALLFKYYLENHNKSYTPLLEQKKVNHSKLEDIYISSTNSMVMNERSTLRKTYILDRGDYQKKIKEVYRDVPAFLKKEQSRKIKDRLELANWIADKENPLTARVIVNRVWMEVFGNSLVPTPENFGIQGGYPSNPQLLDYLAHYLISNDWNIKKLISHIIESSTFRQSSSRSLQKIKTDPENNLYSSYPRHRLRAEFIRDQALSISGLLNSKKGGKPVFPYQPDGLWNTVSALSSDTRFYEISEGSDKYRRSIYTFWKRSLPPPSMTIFNSPNRQTCVIKRNYSNTPQQALVTLNDPQFTEFYENYSEKNKTLNIHGEELIIKLYKDIYNRKPSKPEIALCLKFLKSKNTNLLIHTLMNTDEFLTVE